VPRFAARAFSGEIADVPLSMDLPMPYLFAVLVVALLIALVIRRRRRVHGNVDALGSMSLQWMAEHRVSYRS